MITKKDTNAFSFNASKKMIIFQHIQYNENQLMTL